jgi:hypothetical protein
MLEPFALKRAYLAHLSTTMDQKEDPQRQSLGHSTGVEACFTLTFSPISVGFGQLEGKLSDVLVNCRNRAKKRQRAGLE